MRVKGIGQAKAEDFHTSARAILAKTPIRRSGTALRLSQSNHELFLDLEATDFRFDAGGLPVTNYLIGVVSHERGTVSYQPFFSQTPDQEEKMLRRFCEYLVLLDDYVIYHWHHYERINLEKMLDFYGFPSRTKAQVLNQAA